MIRYPLTLLQCSSISDGAATVILASEKFVAKHKLHCRAVEILGMSLVSDSPQTFKGDHVDLIGYEMTKRCLAQALLLSNKTISDVDVVELHDANAVQELATYEALGLC